MKRLFSGMLLAVTALMLGAAQPEVVTYERFGAKGDGKTNDHDAIREAHDYANEHGLPVRANDNATYYIGVAKKPAVIKTNTTWGKAKFIIDDTIPDLPNFKSAIFQIAPSRAKYDLKDVPPLKKGMTNFPVELDGPALVIVFNDNRRQFIRYGDNANNGSIQQDLMIVFKDGRIDPMTPIVWDFDAVTRAEVYPIDAEQLNVIGGHFTTLANKREGRHVYFGRGLTINRSNTLVQNVRHDVIEGGGIDSWPYTGFFNVNRCAMVTIRDCFVTGRKLYDYPIPGQTKRKTTGTYDISGGSAARISFINCVQTNDIIDPTYWGVMGTNFCKALLLDGCRLSRFDAHQGVTNAVMRNTTVGYLGINAIGFGTFVLENVTSHANRMVNFRSDYGATWTGNFILKNCTLEPRTPYNHCNVFVGGCTPTHDFGYQCTMPTKITIDGLKIKLSGKGKTVAIFDDMDRKNLNDGAPYPYIVTEELEVNNISGVREIPLSRNKQLFRNTRVTGRDAGKVKR